jgi:AcrR family transcriptional regulator
MNATQRPTKQRIVDAATKLFYAEGIGRVSVDAVAAKAGVTKRTLYYHFASKDDLVTAYLDGRDQPNLKQFASWYSAQEGDPAARAGAMFDGLAQVARHSTWRGCGFLRTAAELVATPGHPAVKAGARHKKSFESWLAGEFTSAGISSAESLAREVVILMDGAFATMLVHRDPEYIEAAGRAARRLVAAAR